MKTKYRLMKLAVVLLCGAALLAPGEISWGDGEFYVVGGGSPWKRNGVNIYYKAGSVGIGTDSPGGSPLSVYGTGNFAIYSTNSASGGTAVEGLHTASSGDGHGVHGESISTDNANACGVYGYARGFGSGVKGSTDSLNSKGVYGENSAAGGIGIVGKNTATYGSGTGVWGSTDSTQIGAVGVVGLASGGGTGVQGFSNNGYGVIGYSNTGYAVYAFGNIGATGNKTAIVPTSQGNRKLYSQESPEVWFEDMGEGQLEGGKAHIDLDPLFLETVTINDQHPMKVFIQLNDDCNGVYVQRGNNAFEVKELRHGTSSAHFTYRIMAKRKGYETARLEAAPDPVKVADLKTPPVAKAPPALAAFQH
jgi:hypothetical protein